MGILKTYFLKTYDYFMLQPQWSHHGQEEVDEALCILEMLKHLFILFK